MSMAESINFVPDEAPENAPERRLMYREALREALQIEMRRDDRVFVLGEGIAERGGSFKVTEGLLAEFGAARIVDTPIAEAAFVGVAVGAAATGMRPVAEILFVDFVMLTMDQLVNQAAKLRFMTGDQCTVPMVLRTQGGTGNGLAAQHSQSLEAIFYHVPGLKVVTPATPRDAKGLLVSAIRDDSPVIFLEHKTLYMTEGEVPEGDFSIPIGEGEVKREGSDVTIVAWSAMVRRVLEAAEQLAAEGISVEVVDPRTLSPLDEGCIVESVMKTQRALIVQEAVRRGGIASDIASIIMRDAFDYLDAPVEILAGLNTPIPYNLELEKVCVPQVDQIVAAVRGMMA